MMITNVQLPLFTYGEPGDNLSEFLPLIWQATEALTAEEPVQRQHGLDAILEVGVQRISTLVAFMIASCINDPDIYIRRRVVYILSDLLEQPPKARPVPNHIRVTVNNHLRRMGEDAIYGLLEVALMDDQIDNAIYRIFVACPSAGRYLGNIIADWNHSLAIRQKAIQLIGLVGYMEAYPALQRMLDRLEARHEGQYSMAFVPASIRSDEDIIPYLRDAIQQLRNR